MINRKIFIVLPCYNEQSRIPAVLTGVLSVVSPRQVVVVDDGSETPLRLSRKYPVILLWHKINLGKGAAMKTGAEFAFGKGAKAVIFMDADGQHNPAELSVFVTRLKMGYDVVFGSRSLTDSSPLIRRLGSKIASVYISFFFGFYVSDILSGFRALTKKAYQLLNWESVRYGVETEMVARLGKHKHSLSSVEIPITTIYKDKYKGATLVQAVKILGESLWWKLS